MAITGKILFGVALVTLALSAYKYHSKNESTPLLGKKFTSISWADCDSSGSKYFDVTNVVMTGTPATGQKVTVTIYGKAKQNFTHASTYWETSYGIWGVQAKGTEVVNPPVSYASPNTFTMVSDQTLNQDPPTGNYQTKNQFKDGTGKTFQCVLIKYAISN